MIVISYASVTSGGSSMEGKEKKTRILNGGRSQNAKKLPISLHTMEQEPELDIPVPVLPGKRP